MRGLLSEAELHTLRLRMDAGRRRQIEQGRYQQHVPTGLVRLEDGSVSKTPDVQVQRTVQPLLVVDNSDVPPSRLTSHCDPPYDKETVPATPFKQRGFV